MTDDPTLCALPALPALLALSALPGHLSALLAGCVDAPTRGLRFCKSKGGDRLATTQNFYNYFGAERYPPVTWPGSGSGGASTEPGWDGRNFPGCDDNPSLVITEKKFWVQARPAADRSQGSDWGFRFTVTPIGPQALRVSDEQTVGGARSEVIRNVCVNSFFFVLLQLVGSFLNGFDGDRLTSMAC